MRVRSSIGRVAAGCVLAFGAMVIGVGGGIATAGADTMTIDCVPLQPGDYNPKPGVYTHRCNTWSQGGMMIESFFG